MNVFIAPLRLGSSLTQPEYLPLASYQPRANGCWLVQAAPLRAVTAAGAGAQARASRSPVAISVARVCRNGMSDSFRWQAGPSKRESVAESIRVHLPARW